ncbi:hypothetical protein KKC44_05145 [Patescibacteria group bacterium]|nr:hypothetical protein [Patescibacteria group bacterium]MBU2259961.1 hypothetical protein [Patescibacteria group bacterium]
MEARKMMSKDPRSPQAGDGTPPVTGGYPDMNETDIAKAVAEHEKAEAERAREQAQRAKVLAELEMFVAQSDALRGLGIRGFVTVFFGRR